MPLKTLADYGRFTAMRAEAAAPTISVITVTFNAATTVARTIESVQKQSFADVEHVFVDGASKDDTVRVIERLKRPVDFLISEPDDGISDAFNRGIALARGRYVIIMNADDWMAPDQLERSLACIEASGADYVFGDLTFCTDDQPVFRYAGDPDYARSIGRRMPAINHPTVLVRRAAYERFGLFDTDYRSAMDYEWLLRLHRAGGRGVHDPAINAFMATGGTALRNMERTMREVRDIAISGGRPRSLAEAEMRMRIAKTRLSYLVQRRAQPAYRLIRSLLNKSFEPIVEERARDTASR